MQGTLTQVEAFWGARCIGFHNRDGSIQDWLHNLLIHHFFRSINLCSKLCSAEGQAMLTAPNYALNPFFIYHMNISTKSSILLLFGPWPDKKCSSLLGSSEGTAACGIQQSFSSFFLKIGFSLREAPAVSESHTWESCKHYARKPWNLALPRLYGHPFNKANFVWPIGERISYRFYRTYYINSTMWKYCWRGFIWMVTP